MFDKNKPSTLFHIFEIIVEIEVLLHQDLLDCIYKYIFKKRSSTFLKFGNNKNLDYVKMNEGHKKFSFKSKAKFIQQGIIQSHNDYKYHENDCWHVTRKFDSRRVSLFQGFIFFAIQSILEKATLAF